MVDFEIENDMLLSDGETQSYFNSDWNIGIRAVL